MSGVASYPRTDGDHVSPEVIQAMLAAGLISEDDVQGYSDDVRSAQPSGREMIKNIVRVVLKNRRHDAAFLERVNTGLLQRQSTNLGTASASVTVYHHTGARALVGFTYERVSYTRQPDRKHYKAQRSVFDRKEREAWLRDIGHNRTPELIAAGFTQKDIDRMSLEGKAPEGYQVHHRIPLDDGGTNDHDNFVLMRDNVEHRALHGYYNPAELRIRLLAYGETAFVALPVPPKDTLVYPNMAMGYVSNPISYPTFLEMFDEH